MDTLRRYKMRSLELKLLRNRATGTAKSPPRKLSCRIASSVESRMLAPLLKKMALQRTSGTGRWLLHPETQYR